MAPISGTRPRGGSSDAASVLRVLLVEDDPDACEVSMDVLRSEGIDVWAASSFETAVDAIADVAPTVVLTDLQLGPRGSGVALAKCVRRSQGRAASGSSRCRATSSPSGT
jgi:CheY-like chemotaxis protein